MILMVEGYPADGATVPAIERKPLGATMFVGSTILATTPIDHPACARKLCRTQSRERPEIC